MRNKRHRPAKKKWGDRRSNSNDFISQMPNDLLVKILSLLPVKDAVVTSTLSSRWRFVWRSLTQLNFDGNVTFDNEVDVDWEVFLLERSNYIKQVDSVIQQYNHPKIQDFRICFYLNCDSQGVIDEWLHFALNKKVEFLELDLINYHNVYEEEYDDRFFEKRRKCVKRYNFSLRLFERNILRTPPLNADMSVELVCLKKLILKNIKVTGAILQELLTNSPYLETIVIDYQQEIHQIRVGGQALSLKHFEIVGTGSVYLSDFDLVSFTYEGPGIRLHLAHLPNLKEIDMYRGLVELDNNVLGEISSCASSLQSLSINIHHPTDDSLARLPNLKKLRLKIGGINYDCLVYLAFILNACPNLETFTIKPFWSEPILNRSKATDVTNTLEHLKLVTILGYNGRKSDHFELAAYLMDTAVALKKIVVELAAKNDKKAADRSYAKCCLDTILPRGVELVIL